MTGRRFLCLGAGDGWHANQLLEAARRQDCEINFATYESLAARVGDGVELHCEAGRLADFDAVLTRTMPFGSLEQVTFRLAVLHDLGETPGAPAIVNPPRSLEIAIDKFATLARVAGLGYAVPETIVAQSHREAIDAFHDLGGDCIVKPVFGGEGRGVMRIQNPELAWYTFWTLEKLDAVCYVQRFVPPGGRDTRLLVIGDRVSGFRRNNHNGDFRTNIAVGGRCEAIAISDDQADMARRICDSIGLRFAAVDLVDSNDGESKVIEVNAIPGWKGTQSAADFDIADRIVDLLDQQASCREARC